MFMVPGQPIWRAIASNGVVAGVVAGATLAMTKVIFFLEFLWIN